jgi:hypothetical protein
LEDLLNGTLRSIEVSGEAVRAKSERDVTWAVFESVGGAIGESGDVSMAGRPERPENLRHASRDKPRTTTTKIMASMDIV